MEVRSVKAHLTSMVLMKGKMVDIRETVRIWNVSDFALHFQYPFGLIGRI
jgi:hypothetical protein